MIFLFPWWDMFVSWRVPRKKTLCLKKTKRCTKPNQRLKKQQSQNQRPFSSTRSIRISWSLERFPLAPTSWGGWKVALSCLECLKRPFIGVKYHIICSFIRPSIRDFVFLGWFFADWDPIEMIIHHFWSTIWVRIFLGSLFSASQFIPNWWGEDTLTTPSFGGMDTQEWSSGQIYLPFHRG